MKIGTKEFDLWNQAYIMGILNVTPDSFSDGGSWTSIEAAQKHAEQMIADGVDIIDVGGESTRPGYTMLSDEEEISRVVPVIEMLKQLSDVPVSVDTYKSKVAAAALAAGADLVNDIWGLKYDAEMAGTIARAGVPCCLMHNRRDTYYEHYLDDIQADLWRCVEIARGGGIPDDHIILDPGIGFGKTCAQNLHLMHHMEIVRELGFPVLLGTSRKSMIGNTLKLPVEEREEGTLVTTVMGLEKGCSIFRVHDVKKNRRALDMAQAILKENY